MKGHEGDDELGVFGVQGGAEITLLGDVCFKFSITFSDASVLYLLTLSLASLLNYVCSP